MRQALWVETDNLIRAANRGTLFMTQHNRFSDYTAEEKRAILNLHAPVSTGRATDDSEVKRVRPSGYVESNSRSSAYRFGQTPRDDYTPLSSRFDRNKNTCAEGEYYYKMRRQCRKCRKGCASCTSLTECTQCEDPHAKADSRGVCLCENGRERDGSCRLACKPDEFFSKWSKKCYRCSRDCQECTEMGKCSKCGNGTELSDGYCLCGTGLRDNDGNCI